MYSKLAIVCEFEYLIKMSPTPQQVVAVAVVLSCLSTIAVALRFYVRKMKKIQLKSDDWTILVALVRWSQSDVENLRQHD